MRVVYFVHDLGDAAVAKRVWMLQHAGAEVRLAGFRRTPTPPARTAGLTALDLGRTRDAQLLSRTGSVLRSLALAPRLRDFTAGADVVIARNLEVYVTAALCRALHAPQARLVYECLDVHRLMLGKGLVGRALRGLEGALLDQSEALIVSSPAFLSAYFEPFQRLSRRTLRPLVIENKALPGETGTLAATATPPPGPPWRIGWFGMIRCRRSLDALCDLARRRPDLVHIDLRGRPSYTEFADFDRQAAETPGLTFGGPYRPQDLPRLYGALHFSWAIDRFQDEGNSRWLLPNRLYEGGRLGVPPIADDSSQTGRWLAAHGLGVLLAEPEAELEAFLDALTPETYATLRARHAAAPQSLFTLGPDDWARLRIAIGAPAEAEADAAAPLMRQA